MIVDREFLYDLEHVRSDFESAYQKYKQNNPDADCSDMENKLLLLTGCITHIHKCHEAIDKCIKKNMLDEFTNQKLLAEIIMLRRKTI